MARTNAILKLVQEQRAPELHLTACSPPMPRTQGKITAPRNETRPSNREAA